MITVFVVLSLVVLTGNLLIRFVNKTTTNTPTKDVPSPSVLAAITGAVEAVTEGKGNIQKIEKQ